jgi:hypothetical protein
MTSEDRIINIFNHVKQHGQPYQRQYQYILNGVIVDEFTYGKNMSSKSIQYKYNRIVLDELNGKNEIVWFTSNEATLDEVEKAIQ